MGDVVMGKKPNPLLAQYEAIWEKRYQARLHEALRIGEDAVLLAADDVLDVDQEQAVLLREAYMAAVRDITKAIVTDSRDDPELAWSTAAVDRRIKGIVGEKHFQPWEIRHQ